MQLILFACEFCFHEHDQSWFKIDVRTRYGGAWLNISTWEAEAVNLYDWKASLVYIVNSRPAKLNKILFGRNIYNTMNAILSKELDTKGQLFYITIRKLGNWRKLQQKKVFIALSLRELWVKYITYVITNYILYAMYFIYSVIEYATVYSL